MTRSWHYDHAAETRDAIDLITSGYFSSGDPNLFQPIRDTLLTSGDHYMHLADLAELRLHANTRERSVRGLRRLDAESHPERRALRSFSATARFANTPRRFGELGPARSIDFTSGSL